MAKFDLFIKVYVKLKKEKSTVMNFYRFQKVSSFEMHVAGTGYVTNAIINTTLTEYFWLKTLETIRVN